MTDDLLTPVVLFIRAFHLSSSMWRLGGEKILPNEKTMEPT